MSVDLKVTLGTVNYTDFLHVTASKVPTPTVVAWEDWINVPVSNYNFIIPGLDPENYYIRYYDAPTNVSLGSIVAEILVNALTGEFIYERRFYTVGAAGSADPADGDSFILDTYLIDKKVIGVFKEAFRYLEPTTEYTFDKTIGRIDIINGTQFSSDEKVTVEIQYEAANSGGTGSGVIYSGNLDIVEATRTLLPAEVNKRLRLLGTGSTQVITLCALSSIAIDNGFYFDNSVGGVAIQVKILMDGLNKIRFNGFNLPSTIFTEFWVSRGEHLLLKKYDDTYWEVVLDYKGTNVGEKLSATLKSHPNTLSENGQLIDGDEYPRLWWWINTVLPATHRYITDTVTGVFVPDADKLGQFAMHSSLKKFRMPSTMGLVEKGLANFEAYGADVANRPVDYPGGGQAQMLLKHRHFQFNPEAPQSPGQPISPVNKPNRAKNPGNTLGYEISGSNTEPTYGLTSETGGDENRVKNTGVIFLRRI